MSDKFFNQAWRDYQDSFVELNGGKRTYEFSYEYFNEKHLLSTNINLRLISSIPAVLVGIGILGTFFGLTYGISNFQTNSTQQIKESIDILLSGMGTAFVSSIYGMFFSLVFAFFDKVQVNSLHNSIHIFCFQLDKKYRISKEDERAIELIRHEKLFNDYFIYKDENGNNVKPGNVFRDIFNENRKQSVALEVFSTDLANLIEAGFERILNDPDKDELRSLIVQLKESTDLMKIALERETQKLGDKLQVSAVNMFEKVHSNIKSSLVDIVTELNKSASYSAKEETENLTKLLSQAGSSLREFPEKLEEMSNKFNQNFQGLQDIVKQISKQILELSEDSIKRMRIYVEELAKLLGEKISELQYGQEVLLAKQKENLIVSDNLLKSFNTSIEHLENLSNQVHETVSSFSKVQSELNSASGQLKSITQNVLSSSNSLKETQKEFAQYSNVFLSKNQSTIEELHKAMTQAKILQNNYTEKFKVIEDGLQSIFQQINAGLISYSDTLGASVENFLGKYSAALTETAKSLSEAALRQEGILEELTEQLSKLQNGRVQ